MFKIRRSPYNKGYCFTINCKTGKILYWENDFLIAETIHINIKQYRSELRQFNPSFVSNKKITTFLDKKMAEKAADYFNNKYAILIKLL